MWFCYVSFSFLSVRSEKTGLGETSPNDLFCVGWHVKPQRSLRWPCSAAASAREGWAAVRRRRAVIALSVWASRLHCSTGSACWPRESASCCKLLLLLLLLIRCQQQQQQHHWPDAWLIATARPSVASPGFSAAAGRSTEARLPRMGSLACPVRRDQRNWSELRPA